MIPKVNFLFSNVHGSISSLRGTNVFLMFNRLVIGERHNFFLIIIVWKTAQFPLKAYVCFMKYWTVEIFHYYGWLTRLLEKPWADREKEQPTKMTIFHFFIVDNPCPDIATLNVYHLADFSENAQHVIGDKIIKIP